MTNKIILILDASYSMKKMPTTAFSSLKEVLLTVEEKDTIVDLFFFGTEVDEATRKTFTIKDIEIAMDFSEGWRCDCGQTALYDAIMHGIKLTEKSEDKSTIIVVTDGVDNKSCTDLETVREKIISFRALQNKFLILLPDINNDFDDVATQCIYFPHSDNKSLAQFLSSGYLSQSLNETFTS